MIRAEARINELKTTIASASRTIVDTRRMILEDLRGGRRTEVLPRQMAVSIVNKVVAQIELRELKAKETKPIVDVLAQLAEGRRFGLQLLSIVSLGSSAVFLNDRKSVLEMGQEGP